MQDYVTIASTIAILLLIAVIGAIWYARLRSLRLDIDPRTKSKNGASFGAIAEDNRVKGHVGELITALLHIQDGWQQLPSQPNGVQGLDGIFVKQAKKPGRYQVRLVETKSSATGDPKNNYNPNQMSDEKVIAQIEDLKQQTYLSKPYLSEAVADEIVRALKRGSPRVSKWFYTHTFETGVTLMYPIARDGKLKDSPRHVQSIPGSANRFLYEALAIGLSRLDRNGKYFEASVAMSGGDEIQVFEEHIQPESTRSLVG